jgi:hypothetical protein
LLDHWIGELGGSGAARMLRAIADAYPEIQIVLSWLAGVASTVIADAVGAWVKKRLESRPQERLPEVVLYGPDGKQLVRYGRDGERIG